MELCTCSLWSPSHTLLHVPTSTANVSGTYGVLDHFVPVPPTSGQQGSMSDGIPSVASSAQYQACVAASLIVSREPSSSGDDDGVQEIE